MTNKNSRLEWVDVLRGIAMLLVLWGHVDRVDRPFFVVTGPFKMPLFFAITGYLFKDRGGDCKLFFTRLFQNIIIPWFILSLVWMKMIYALVRGRPNLIPAYLYNFISGKDFWFMPCIIIAETLFFLICKYISDVRLRYAAMLLVSLVGIILSHFGIAGFAMIDVACTAQIFLLFGYWFRNNETLLREKFSAKLCVGLAALYFVLLGISAKLFPGQSIDVHTNRYFNYPLCFLMSFVSLLFLFLVAPKVRANLRWIIFVGRNTIVFYIVHYHARSLLIHGLHWLGFTMPKTLPWFVVTYLFICVSMSIVAVIINKWFPFILGKKRVRTE
ncbi:MAG: acyltransferase [Lachnospiraceae bacterium]|nr:acyltransferase [Lachnospiraceae bacterium]